MTERELIRFQVGDVWRSPGGIDYKVVEINANHGYGKVAIMRAGADGTGRKLSKFQIDTPRWTRISKGDAA